MNWKPRLIIFQCQFCLYSEVDQHWMEHQLSDNMKLVKVPCTGRISPLFILNAIQSGADGVLVSGCKPEVCHFKEGNLGARRQLSEFSDFLTYVGLDQNRIKYVWMDVSERGRIQKEIAEFEKNIIDAGPLTRLVTRKIAVTGAVK